MAMRTFMKSSALAAAAAFALAATLSGCSTFGVAPFPEPIRPPIETEGEDTPIPETQAEEANRYSPTPGVRITRTQARGAADELGTDLEGPSIEAAFNGVPIVAFINEVFGTELGMSFVISPGLQEKTDLVTLRLTSPVPPRQFFNTARQVLQEYGVTIRERDGVLTFLATQEIESGEVPLLISGRTLPEVPATHRTVFQLVPLHVAAPNQVISMLRDAFPRNDLESSTESDNNAVLLKGTPDRLAQALELIEVLDQPMLRGRHGLIVEPQFLAPEPLASAVKDVMAGEGYNMAGISGSALLLPFDDLGKLVVFAQSQAVLDHVTDWIETFDESHRGEIESGLFTYEVQNTQVVDMAETLGKLVGSVLGGASDRAGGGTGTTGAESPAMTAGSRSSPLVVDEKRNLIIFRGSGEEWAGIREVVEKLDKPVPSVMIEVLIAEVSLTDEEKTGFDFLFNSGIDRFGLRGGTRDALGISNQGLSLTLDSAGQTRAVLSLFYKNDKVAIRSQPRLLVKSGEEASIQVGNDIPVITQLSQDSVQVGGSTNVLQQVNYRTTGVVLSISPLVQAGGLVDIAINQELSEARPTAATSLGGSPTILSRTLSTSLSLKDGGSLLMGGLISENRSTGTIGVPGLSRVPVLGHLFRSDTFNGDRTELMVMVTPYVVRDHAEGSRLTERLKAGLELHDRFTLD
ncbi:MAG: hypothetical protein F4229_10950 [Gammaproteobacteria bacterium]|nr:hypothetical protein [Gammaproteobacteria bacterium]MYH15709.1 hypothetical protein [Gammaproteobacteria bacterium]